MLPLYGLIFCRITIGVVFAASAVGKARQFATFERTIADFGLLPAKYCRLAARGLLGGEGLVVASMAIGGPLLLPGFLLAGGLLLLFSAAIKLALGRGIRTSCGCFGPSERPVATYDIWRNVGLTICAIGGGGLLPVQGDGQASPGGLQLCLIGLAALVFAAGWAQLGEIAQLLRPG